MSDIPQGLPMERDAVTGVWSVGIKRKWLGRYYRYRVEVWHPAAQRVVTTSVTDHRISDSTPSTSACVAAPPCGPPMHSLNA